MESPQIRKKRASSSESAREYRKQGHDDALEFAHSIGLPSDYKNDPQAKKDVIDQSGEAHTVKSGQKKWQIFLYGKGRFESDDAFKAMNGIGDLLIECINAFPPAFDQYQTHKQEAKEKLRIPMKKLAGKLQNPNLLRGFLAKSLFNGNEATYLTVKHNGIFHIFWNKDVINTLGQCLEVCNSKAIISGQTPEQKVLFRYGGVNVGEVEMRNESLVHYQEIRFNMIKPKIMKLLFEKIPLTAQFNESVLVYGNAPRHFARWQGAPKLTSIPHFEIVH